MRTRSTAASENVARNRRTTVSLRQVDLASDAIDGAPFDVVLANLTGAHLTRYASANFIGRGARRPSHRQRIPDGRDAAKSSEALALDWAGVFVEAVSEAEWVGLCSRF